MSNKIKTTEYEGRQVEYIDCTPTWQACAKILMLALEQGNEEGKKSARKEIMHMAEVAQAYADEVKERGDELMKNEIGTANRNEDEQRVYYLKLTEQQMYIAHDALCEYTLLSGLKEMQKRNQQHQHDSNVLRNQFALLFYHGV